MSGMISRVACQRFIFLTIVLCLFLFSSSKGFAQVIVELKVKQSIGNRAKLSQYIGKELIVIDSCRSTDGGVYRFDLSSSTHQGLYRIAIGKSSSFDFIVTNEPEIVFETVVFAVEDSLRVIKSKENKVFIDYSKLKRQREQQQWLIGSLQNYYTSDFPFAQQLRDEKQRVEFEFYQKALALSETDSTLFVSNYIKLDTRPFVINALDECSYKAQMAKEWWQGVNLSDERLLNTPLLIKNVWDYLENSICEDRYDKEQQDSVFVAQVDALLTKNMTKVIKNQIVSSLCKSFADTDYFETISYLLSKGGDGANAIRENHELIARLTLEKTLAIGCRAHDFKVKPLEERPFKLMAHKSQYRLIVFWSIWCPHCVEMMPNLVNVYNDYRAKGFEIIAISIDEEVDQLKRFLADKQFPWVNMQDADYNSPIMLKYNVDETPKMFLLDKDLKIVSRPSSAEQLRLKLKRLL